jgi:hypothetical protein
VENKTKVCITVGAVLLCIIVFGAGFLFGRKSISDDSIAARQLQQQLDTIITNQSAITSQVGDIKTTVDGIQASNSGIQQSITDSETAVDAGIESNTAASNANNAAANTNTEIADNLGQSGMLISELQAILDDVSKHPQTP